MKKIEMKPGKTIFKAGEPADGLYIVGSGEVGIYFPTNKEMAEPDIILKANEILGEMGVIDTAPRMATAKAYSDALVTINRWYDDGHLICFFTSRVEAHRTVTEKWLKSNGSVSYTHLTLPTNREV